MVDTIVGTAWCVIPLGLTVYYAIRTSHQKKRHPDDLTVANYRAGQDALGRIERRRR